MSRVPCGHAIPPFARGNIIEHYVYRFVAACHVTAAALGRNQAPRFLVLFPYISRTRQDVITQILVFEKCSQSRGLPASVVPIT